MANSLSVGARAGSSTFTAFAKSPRSTAARPSARRNHTWVSGCHAPSASAASRCTSAARASHAANSPSSARAQHVPDPRADGLVHPGTQLTTRHVLPQRLDHGTDMADRLPVPASRVERAGEHQSGADGSVEIVPAAVEQGERSLADIDGLLQIAAGGEQVGLARQYAAQSDRVIQALGQSLRLGEVGPGPAQLADRVERPVEQATDVDHLAQRLSRLLLHAQCRERPLEERRRLPVGGAGEGATRRPRPRARRPARANRPPRSGGRAAPAAALGGLREALLQDRRRSARAAAAAGSRSRLLVGGVLHQRVLEACRSPRAARRARKTSSAATSWSSACSQLALGHRRHRGEQLVARTRGRSRRRPAPPP